MTTILVAEDSPVIQKIVKKALEERGYEVLAADNGAIAYQLMETRDIDLLLSDWQMPEMDGIQLITKVLKRKHRAQPYIILLTSLSETENLVQGLEAGADDYLCKPFSPDELNARIKAGLRVLKLQRKLDFDLRQVGQLQLNLLPKSNPTLPGLEVQGYYVPSTQASGDYYDFFPAPGGQLGIFVADVCDHGAPAAVFMAIIHAVMHSHNEPFDQPGLVLANTNSHLVKYGEEGTFATALFAVYNPNGQTLKFANSGHPRPLHFHAATGQVTSLAVAIRPPLASLPYSKPPEEATVQLAAGDRVLLYTDGITEVFDPDNAMFGEERLAQALAKPAVGAGQIITNILADVNAFAREVPFDDDQTMVVLVQG